MSLKTERKKKFINPRFSRQDWNIKANHRIIRERRKEYKKSVV